MKCKKSKKIKKNLFYKIISVVLALSSIFFLGLVFYVDLLPTKYSLIILFAILLFNVFNIFLVNLKNLKRKIKKVLSLFMIIAILLLTFANFYIGKTLGVLFSNGDSKYKLENYSVIVLENSNYNKLEDIKDEQIGYFKNSTGAKEANDKLSKEIDVDFKSYKTSDSMIDDLLNSKINAIVIEESIKDIMEEESDKFEESTKVIYTFKIRIAVETALKEVDVTKEPFAIYISGIDTYGEISSVSRSDVNMVVVANPNIRQILLISIPRDYYVQLHGTTGTKDKLTHAGIYGVDMSIQTIEDLLELDINYYLKVNFTSVIDIVDALGGLDVYSEYSFTSYSGYQFKKGLNYVNGKQALDFARTRKAFSDGDRQRGKNQQAVIEAIIRKATDKSIITKYNSLLNAINGKYQTNMSMKKITSIIKMQLEDMSPWNITSYSLTGTDLKDYTYTYNQLLYVMKPDQDSVDEAIELIDRVLVGEQLDNSYENIGGISNKVTQIQTNKNNVSNKKENDIVEKPLEDLDKENESTEETDNQEVIENQKNEIIETPENMDKQPETDKNVNEEINNDDNDSISDSDIESSNSNGIESDLDSDSDVESGDPITTIIPSNTNKES